MREESGRVGPAGNRGQWREIKRDPQADKEVRDYLQKLWSIYEDMKTLFEKPGGRTLDEFLQKAEALRVDFNKHYKELNDILEIDDDQVESGPLLKSDSENK